MPAKAPSFFFIDIPAADAARFDAFVQTQAPGSRLERVPMLRGRIVEANGIKADDLKPAAGSRWVLRGDPATIESWRRELAKLYAPRRMVLAVPADAADLPAAIAAKTARGAAVAYVCRGNSCGEPIASFPELTEALRA